MDKKILKQLVAYSLTGSHLDNKKVMKIANQLNRKQLKAYIDGLKRWIQKNTVIVESAKDVSQGTKNEYKKAFSGKDVVFTTNPNLLVGTRIIDSDTIYELNLKDTLDHIKQYVTQE